MPILFSSAEYTYMSGFLCEPRGLRAGQFSFVRYPNQELHVEIQSAVAGEHCLILGSLAPPDSQMVSLLLLAHTLRKEGAKRITGLLPYLAYAREDKIKPGRSLGTAWLGGLLQAATFDEIWTVDAHSEHDHELLPLPLKSLSPAPIFGNCLEKHGLADASFVAPDEGARARCEAIRSAAGATSANIVWFEKERTDGGIVHHDRIGQVRRRAVIVDDVLDTGATLTSACERLVTAGVVELYVCVTHGLFTGQRWRDLWSLPLKHIFCTDTIPACSRLEDPRITTLPVSPLLRTQLGSIL